MKRIRQSIRIEDPELFKKKLLSWAQDRDVVFWLDSNTKADNFNSRYSSFDAVLAVDVNTELRCDCSNAFEKLKTFRKAVKDYVFGFLSYDLKNDIENLTSDNFDGVNFPDLYFFQPQKLFFLKGTQLDILYLNPFGNDIDSDLKAIRKSQFVKKHIARSNEIKTRISKKEYLEKLDLILEHIHRGDIYEVNFCQEFYTENSVINPLAVYEHLNTISEPPFANFVKLYDKYLLSASPERFVKKIGNKIISQPIKGTAKRMPDSVEDMKIAETLANDPKERSENIMIVDLVRNDLSKFALPGTVKVEELCGVYSFKQVHQLISTVSCRVSQDTEPEDLIKSLFPMGSMTGAPKISAMKIIEETEATRRGLYSGAVGYFTPDNDFDFNVVIRSILHNQKNRYTSFIVGGAITALSDKEKEYEECMLKAAAMKKALKFYS